MNRQHLSRIYRQMTDEALEEAANKEYALQMSRTRPNLKLFDKITDEIERRARLGSNGPVRLEDYLG